MSTEETLTLVQARDNAKRWVWAQMSTKDRLVASRKIYDEQGASEKQYALLGFLTWGPANPGYLSEHCRGLLFARVRDWVIRNHPHGAGTVRDYVIQ